MACHDDARARPPFQPIASCPRSDAISARHRPGYRLAIAIRFYDYGRFAAMITPRHHARDTCDFVSARALAFLRDAAPRPAKLRASCRYCVVEAEIEHVFSGI